MHKRSLLPVSYESELTKALEEILREIEELPIDVIKDFWNPLKCREDLLPYLASFLGVTMWDSAVPVEQKRQGCLNALTINKQKGTLGALKLALKSSNLNCTLREWWQAEGSPAPKEENSSSQGKENGQNLALQRGSAEIILQENEIIYSEEQYKTIYKLIDEVKRLSLHITIKKQNAIVGKVYINSAEHNIARNKINYEALKSKAINVATTMYNATNISNMRRITIW